MTSRPSRAAAANASRNLRDTSSSPELSPPPPPKRARSAKQQSLAQSSRSRGGTNSKAKQSNRRAAPETLPEETKPDVIEIYYSDDNGEPVAEPECIPKLIEEIPSLSGEMVFVKIRLDGSVAEGADDEGLWWPTGIVNHGTDGTLEIFLLSTVSSGVSRHRVIPAALRDSVVRPMRSSSGVLSADISNFKDNLDPNQLPSSSFKRLDAAFKQGLKRMNAGDDDAEFPTVSTLLASNTYASERYDPPVATQTVTWTAPGPERNLEIPGELVLATQLKPHRIRPNTEYWAGRIDAYVFPSNSQVPPKYTVTFFEDTVDNLERSQFFTAAEAQFVTCLLGKVESNDTVNDIDEDPDESDGVQFEPFIPPPSPKEFDELPLLHQFAYIVPVLQAIINDKYEPAKALHEDFMHGGTARIKLRKKSPSIGPLKETAVKKLWELVDNWALGRETRITLPTFSDSGVDGDPVPLPASREGSADTKYLSDLSPSSLPTSSRDMFSTGSSAYYEVDPIMPLPSRPHGCEYYESLSDGDRREYCSLILHGEAILQLLLWRTGRRDFLEPASADVEENLRQKAIKLSKQGDIQTLVLELRKQRLGAVPWKHESTVVGPKALSRAESGTRSRPRRGSFRAS